MTELVLGTGLTPYQTECLATVKSSALSLLTISHPHPRLRRSNTAGSKNVLLFADLSNTTEAAGREGPPVKLELGRRRRRMPTGVGDPRLSEF
jgi:hypothetical protein